MRLRITRSRTRETDLEDLEVLERIPLGRQRGERKLCMIDSSLGLIYKN